MSDASVNRRDALRKLAIGGLGTATAPLWTSKLSAIAFAHSHAMPAPADTAGWVPTVLDPHQDETVTVLSELIIPQTDTPGAKVALVNRFVDAVLADAEESERKTFFKGLAWLDARSRELFGADFVKAAPEQQTALLTILSSPNNKTLEDQVGIELFQAMKSMTITGYYTSEIGQKQELGDDGTMFFAEFKGCRHPEHGAPPAPAARSRRS
jgi:Gluconate 2-dehydrogenase subunit 3